MKKHSFVILHPRQPSHTLTTLPDDILHYSENRILTVREFARLQSFPDWFAFQGNYTTGGKRRTHECPRYTQVGNAVAPFLAEVLGMALAELKNILPRASSTHVAHKDRLISV
jgi:DNA (cytosine-5)-methyltransferase 1